MSHRTKVQLSSSAQVLADELDAFVVRSQEGEDVSAAEVTVIVQKAMELEKSSDPSDAVAVLSHAVRVVAEPEVLSMILNNLACVEKRRGRPKIALLHLERAAENEGGLEQAKPTTLLNLAATHAACNQFAESAALAHHAIHRISEIDALAEEGGETACRPELRAAAYHNLAVALEGSQDTGHALAAYQAALDFLPEDHSMRPAIEKSLAAVAELRDDAQRAEKRKAASTIRKTAHELKKSSLPPLKQPSSLQDSTASAYLSSQPRKRTKFDRLPAAPARSKSAPLVQSAIENSWNPDPVSDRPKEKSPYHVQNNARRNFDVERRVEEQYIPRQLVPLVEDLRYKEATRRRALLKEWKNKCRELRHGMQLLRAAAIEDETRGELIIDEQRVRGVLQRWISGKLIFAEGSLACEAEEAAARDALTNELQQSIRENIAPYDAEVKLMASEECGRHDITTQESETAMQLWLQQEESHAKVHSKRCLLPSNRGVALAMVVWSLETALQGAQPALDCVEDSMRNSLYVSERYVWFGIPQHAQPPPNTDQKETLSPKARSK